MQVQRRFASGCDQHGAWETPLCAGLTRKRDGTPMSSIRPMFPDGHYYSPVVSVEEATKDQERIWREQPEVRGIDFNERGQRQILKSFPKYLQDYRYSDDPPDDATGAAYYHNNPQFGWLDSRALFVMLRRLRPKTMIEVGSGFSSLLTADVNRRFRKGKMHFTCIEPYPAPFLVQGVEGINAVIPQRVQDVPVSLFERLYSGDVLFIDSSHVAKTGSDVNHLVFEVLPRLRKGVVVHFHDIFLPGDYLKEWVLVEGRSWNEEYLVRALLMFNSTFTVLFGSMYAYMCLPELLTQALSGQYFIGGSLWVRKAR